MIENGYYWIRFNNDEELHPVKIIRQSKKEYWGKTIEQTFGKRPLGNLEQFQESYIYIVAQVFLYSSKRILRLLLKSRSRNEI